MRHGGGVVIWGWKAMRLLIAVAIAVVATGAAIGGLVASGHGGWTVLGGSVTGVTAFVGSTLWDVARDKPREKAELATSAAPGGTGVTVEQHIGWLSRGGKVHAVRGNRLEMAHKIKQWVIKVGRAAEVTGVDNAGVENRSPDQS
jgi:hypothetical protein